MGRWVVISHDIVSLVPPEPAYDPMRGTTQSHIQGHLTARKFRCMFTIAGHVGTRRLYVVLLVTKRNICHVHSCTQADTDTVLMSLTPVLKES